MLNSKITVYEDEIYIPGKQVTLKRAKVQFFNIRMRKMLILKIPKHQKASLQHMFDMSVKFHDSNFF